MSYRQCYGDGVVNTKDVSRIYSHVRETTNIADEYIFACTNVISTNSVINNKDVSRIYAHVRETNLLW